MFFIYNKTNRVILLVLLYRYLACVVSKYWIKFPDIDKLARYVTSQLVVVDLFECGQKCD
jgi:hypothetical protein